MSNNHGYPGAEGHIAPPRPYWIGLFLIAMGAVWCWGGLSLPQGARYAAVGPGLVPTLTGAGLMIIGLILLAQIHRGESFLPQSGEDVDALAPMDKRAFFTALTATALPMLLIKPLGMPITATICFIMVANALGSRKILLDLVCGVLLASAAWLLFRKLGLNLGPALPFIGG